MTEMNFLKNLKVWQKLAIVAGTLLVPIVVLTYQLLSSLGEQTAFVKKELEGVEYLQSLGKIEQLVPQHRGYMNGYLNGDKSVGDRISTIERDLEDAIKAVDAVDAKLNASLNTSEKWKVIRDDWSDLKATSSGMKPAESFEKHTQLMVKVLELAGHVGDISNLIYDPVNVSYALQDNIVYRIPTTTEYIGLTRGFANGLATRKSMTTDERNKLANYKGKIEASRDLVKTNVDLILDKADAATKAKVDKQYAQGAALTDAFLASIDKNFLDVKEITIAPKDVWETGTRAIDAYVGINGAYEATIPALTEVLAARKARYNRSEVMALIAIVFGVALSLSLAYLVASGISRQAASLQNTFNKIGMGEFETRAQVTSNDELGVVTQSLNAMLDNTMALIQSQDERDSMQNSIVKLLEEVAGVGDGDLTKEAEVTADAMGAVADSFNYMIVQLRDIIGNVQKATRQVTSSANEIYGSAQTLTNSSEHQSMQIVNTSAAVDEMAVSIQQVSENAGVSANVANQALATAKTGNEAVRNTIAGMDRIRDQVQETAKRIKRLGESSQEIGQIIQLIDDIADRTSILALNASIQAAMAGEAGRGFAVVAEEVERLADRSTDATKKISNLVKTIQTETNEAVSAMEKGIQEVVEGSKLAGQAGQSLHEIESVSNKLADLIQSISLAAKQQARASEGVAKSMSEISEITQSTAAGTKQAATQVNGLSRLAQDLRNSVSRFKLPGGISHERDLSPASIADFNLGTNGHNNGHTNGHSNGHSNGHAKSGSRF
jgi:twitching motility protein PilJ